MFVPCTMLQYDSTAATQTLKLSTTLLRISCGIHLISLLMMPSCLWIVFTNSVSLPHFSNRSPEYLRHNFPWDRLILPQINILWPSYSQDLNLPDYFLRGAWKTKFVKRIPRQERTSPEKKSDGFHNKCSVELWAILKFELLLCCHTEVWCIERT